MKKIKTQIPDVVAIQPTVYDDERGHFFESFSEKWFNENVRPIKWVQENESQSVWGVVRGLHFQTGEYAQSKLVRCVRGCLLDVAVDIRKGSPTFGYYVSAILSSGNHTQLFIPRGFAHGFISLSSDTVLQYKVDNYYNKESEGSIYWNDPDINIGWGYPVDKVIVSSKDNVAPLLKDCKNLFDYNIDYYAEL